MYKIFPIGVILCFLATLTSAQTINYHIDLIPKQLHSYANAVIRAEENVVEVKALNQVIHKYKKATTILNGNGAEYADIHIFYDKSSPVKNLKATIYDEAGKIIRKVAGSDFQDVSAINDFSLFEDNRVKYFTPMVTHYPFTVAYEYEIRYKNTLFFPNWVPQHATDIAVEKSSYQFISKPDYAVRLKEFNLPAPHQETKTATHKTLNWEASNMVAIKPEPFSPPARQYLPIVHIAPISFEYEGISGQFTNWQEYGKWVHDNLLAGRDILPASTVQQVIDMVKDISSPYEKVKKIYEYSQQKNRYISVQIGIGGLQPMKAEEVEKLSYGDCKALTNYTKALLKAAGIASIYTEVNAGQAKINYFPDFASATQGNHVILCVPMAQDTIWLECTSRDTPLGYLGTFTDDRQVLLCTEKGGIITRTPNYAAIANRQIRQATFNIDEKGLLDGYFETRFEGTQYDNRDNILNKAGKERQNEVKNIYPINNLELLSYDIKQQKNQVPYTAESVKIKAANYASVNNNMLFIPVFNLDNSLGVPKEVRNRKQKVFVQRGFHDEDLIKYILPAGFEPEYIPQPVDLTCEFGTYSSSTVLTNGQALYTRKLTLTQGEFAPDTYDKLVIFLKKIADADREKLVLVKK